MQPQNEFSFVASLQTLNESNHTATFYLMNTSPNGNRWGVTSQALQEALPTINGKKIGMGKNYQTEKHFSQTMDSGTFINYQFLGYYALATAQIDDAQTWQMMKAGELGPISVIINCYSDLCSNCDANLRGIEEPARTHSCFVNDATYSKVDSFTFSRVDFVDVPAYPQAGILEMSAAAFYSPRYTTLDEAVKAMRAQLRLPDRAAESEFTIRVGALPTKAEYTPKEAADLEKAIVNMRIRIGLAPGYES